MVDCHLGQLKGGPRSPLLANVPLEEEGKALDVRVYSFARYADYCNVDLGCGWAGGRVVVYVRKPYSSM